MSDFCYKYGKLDHTSNNCVEEVITSETKPGFPLYGPWLSGTRSRLNNKWFHVGEGSRPTPIEREVTRMSWRDVMKGKRRGEGGVLTRRELKQLTRTKSGLISRSRIREEHSNQNNAGFDFMGKGRMQPQQENPIRPGTHTYHNKTIPMFDLNEVPGEGEE